MLYQTAAKASFVAGGYAVHLGMGKHLGPAAYGTIGIILSITNILRILIMNGMRQAVSRLTAVSEVSAASEIRHKALQAQSVFVTVVTLIYLALVSPLSQWLGDETLVPYLRLAALFIPLAGFYVIYLSSLNGLREFDKQAGIIILYNVVRVLGSLGLVLLGFHVYGAVIGLLLAPLAALVAGWLVTRDLDTKRTRRQHTPVLDNSHTATLVRFGVPMLFYAVGTSVLLNLSLFLVKRTLSGETAAGIYAAAMALSQSLYYMAQVFVEILFPSVGAISSRLDRKEVVNYIRRWLRLATMALFLGSMLLSTGAYEIVKWTYDTNYTAAAGPLAWLSWGMCFYALFVILTNIIAALGKPWVAFALTLGLVPLSAVLNAYLIPEFNLTGAAMATTGILLMGTVGAFLWLSASTGHPLDILTLVRICLATLLAETLVTSSDLQNNLLRQWGIAIPVYFSALIVSGELTQNDWAAIKKQFSAYTPGRTQQ
jgi:stage V sporulation protein B